jgi:hypothetical protein
MPEINSPSCLDELKSRLPSDRPAIFRARETTALDPSQAHGNEVFEQVRQISHGFQQGLTCLFGSEQESVRHPGFIGFP